MELSEEVYIQIKEHCKAGDEKAENEHYQSAYDSYMQAWSLIPEPKNECEASTWVLTALADTYFYTKNFEAVKDSLQYAMHCPNGIGNPFIHMRLGQALLELGNEEQAKEELARALMGAGKEIFEDDDPKYFEFISKYMKPPAGQESW